MDWVAFLNENEIPYVTRGPNTKRGEVSVKCPWCGDEDPSEHLGISLTSENWGCYRSADHRGHAPSRLVQALLGSSFGEARQTVKAYSHADPDSLNGALAALTRMGEAPKPVTGPLTGLGLPPGCWPIAKEGSTARFWQYLSRRHFDDVDDLVSRYQLQCGTTGVQKDRIVIPLYQGGELTGWTGRAIQEVRNAPRYLSSSEAVKRLIFNEDDLKEGGKILFVVEGPFDALKLDYYGEPLAARATCLFGVTMTMDQIFTLNRVKRNFKKTVILFDRGAAGPAFDACDWVQGPNVVIGSLPEGLKDPGAMKCEEVEKLIKEFL